MKTKHILMSLMLATLACLLSTSATQAQDVGTTPKLQPKRTSYLAAFFNTDPDLRRAAEIFEVRDEKDQPGVLGELSLEYYKNGRYVGQRKTQARVKGCDERYYTLTDKKLEHPRIFMPAPEGSSSVNGAWAMGLRAIFFPNSNSNPTRVGVEWLEGRKVIRFRYKITRANSGMVLTDSSLSETETKLLVLNPDLQGTGVYKKSHIAGFHGDFLLDAKTRDIIAFSQIVDDIPEGSNFTLSTLQVFLGWVDVLGKEPMLVPVTFTSTTERKDGSFEFISGSYTRFKLPGKFETTETEAFSPFPILTKIGGIETLGLRFPLMVAGIITPTPAKPTTKPPTMNNKQIEALLEQNTFKVEAKIAGKRFIGTAFAYGHEDGKTLFVTSAHVEGEIKLSRPGLKGAFVGVIEKIDPSHDRMKITVAEYLPTADVEFADPDIEGIVWNLGYPNGSRKITLGKVEALYRGTTHFGEKQFGPFVGYRAKFAINEHGQSGSIALDQWGRVALLLSGTPEKSVGSTEAHHSFVHCDGGESLGNWLKPQIFAQKR